jgi:hypothetical protein
MINSSSNCRFPVYRHIATMIRVPGSSRHAASLEMVGIDPKDLRTAQDKDKGRPSTGNMSAAPTLAAPLRA